MGKKHASQYANFGWLHINFRLLDLKVNLMISEKIFSDIGGVMWQHHPFF